MAQFSTEQIYRAACSKYEEIKDTIAEMTELVNQVNGGLKYEAAMTAFDLMIQATLLNVAVVDGSFQTIEKEFITVLTEYGDLMNFVNNEAKTQDSTWIDVEWDDIEDLDAETKKKLAAIAASVVDPYATSFVNIFAVIDKLVEERDYLCTLREAVCSIIISLSLIDGDEMNSKVANAEGYVGLSVIDLLLTKKWEEITNE